MIKRTFSLEPAAVAVLDGVGNRSAYLNRLLLERAECVRSALVVMHEDAGWWRSQTAAAVQAICTFPASLEAEPVEVVARRLRHCSELALHEPDELHDGFSASVWEEFADQIARTDTGARIARALLVLASELRLGNEGLEDMLAAKQVYVPAPDRKVRRP